MLRLIPAPLHRTGLRLADRVRRRWFRWRRPHRTSCSVILSDLAGQLLLVRHSYGSGAWCFPGGGVAKAEEPEAALRREMREELGIAIDGLRPIAMIEEDMSGSHDTVHLYAGKPAGHPRPDGREVIEARFFPAHSLPHPLGPKTRRRLELWTKMRG